jgi:hypothetical protein
MIAHLIADNNTFLQQFARNGVTLGFRGGRHRLVWNQQVAATLGRKL